jgi:monoamine oxidase
MKKVIIIGAGISGLAAANNLTNKGFEVLVLESSERVGGRIKTSRDKDGLFFEEGASWIHGNNQDNTILKLAEYLELKLDRGFGVKYYDKNGLEYKDMYVKEKYVEY